MADATPEVVLTPAGIKASREAELAAIDERIEELTLMINDSEAYIKTNKGMLKEARQMRTSTCRALGLPPGKKRTKTEKA